MKIIHYSLVFALVAAPMLATDKQDDFLLRSSSYGGQGTKTNEEDDSDQPKTFWDRCYEQRYAIIGVGAALVATAIATVCINHYLTTGKLPIDPTALIKPTTETPKVELPKADLPQEKKGFAYPNGYSEKSQKHVDDLKELHKVFESMCNGECKILGDQFIGRSPLDTLDCAQAVAALEEMHRTGEKKGHLIAHIAERELNCTILDPIECLDAKKFIEQAVDKLCPAPAQSKFGLRDFFEYFFKQG